MDMTAQPTGTRAIDGALELRREFPIAPAELWAYLTESPRTAQWFGPWQAGARPGEAEVVLLAEDGAPSERIQILTCDRSAHALVVRTGEGAAAWRLELNIESQGTGSRLVFRMPGLDPQQAGSVGPGWEYYLDRLKAAVQGTDIAAVQFEADYYPAMSDYYESLFLA